MNKLLSPAQVLTEIKAILKVSGIKTEINYDSKIARLKIDSLELLNLIIKIEQKLELKLDDAKIIHAQTVGDLIDLIINTQQQ